MDMTSGVHVGMTFIDGVEVHQLAFRGEEVDWQLWVTAGDRPLPLRYVVTSRSVAGTPQYTLQLGTGTPRRGPRLRGSPSSRRRARGRSIRLRSR